MYDIISFAVKQSTITTVSRVFEELRPKGYVLDVGASRTFSLREHSPKIRIVSLHYSGNESMILFKSIFMIVYVCY